MSSDPIDPDSTVSGNQANIPARIRSELEPPGYEPAPYPVEELKERLERILVDVDEELDRR